MVAVPNEAMAAGTGSTNEKPPSRWPQFLAAILATLCATSSGTVLGWTSPSLPMLEKRDLVVTPSCNGTTNITLVPAMLTDNEASWVGSLVPLGALLGSIPAGFLADALGRKPVMLGIGAHFLLGWVLISVAIINNGVWLLFCGRTLQGACCGAITVVAPLYLEETAEAAVRGCTGVLFDLATNVGVLAAYVLGALLPPAQLSASLASLPIAFLFSFAWMPESPVHLVGKGRDARARRALSWLRAGRDVTEELEQMRELLRSIGRLRSVQPQMQPDVEAQAQAHAQKQADKGAQKRTSLPALLTPPPQSPRATEPGSGRRYSANLCLAQAAPQLHKDPSSSHVNAAFEDTEPTGAIPHSQAAVTEGPQGGLHRALSACASSQPIIPPPPPRPWSLRDKFQDLRWGSPALRSLGVVFGLMVIRPASGINAITFYTVSIFAEAGTSLSPNVATILIGSLLVPCNLLASRLVDRVGRRVLLLASSTGITLCYALMVAYNSVPGLPSWLPILAVAVFTVSFCHGLGPLPWLLMSELLPLRHRRWAAGAAGAVAWTGAFAVAKWFSSAMHALGPQVTYAGFCTSAAAGALFIAIWVPETRGKTRQELQT